MCVCVCVYFRQEYFLFTYFGTPILQQNQQPQKIFFDLYHHSLYNYQFFFDTSWHLYSFPFSHLAFAVIFYISGITPYIQ